MTTPAVSAQGLGHRYRGGHWGLRDCSLSVPGGRVVALVGPNGAGKTTLLNLAAGLLRPSAGSVRIAGGAPEAELERIGYIAQDAPLWPRLRVADVFEIGRALNRRFDPALVADRVQRFELPLRARVHTLSGGQRAQVALTMVLAKRPDVLLLDEPLANLDPLARREFLASMFAACAESGTSVLFSSHAVAELERICDYLVVVRDGRVRLAGDVDDLRAAHRVVTGPRGWPERTGAVVVSANGLSEHTVALVDTRSAASPGPGYAEAPPTFDELVLGYLAEEQPTARQLTLSADGGAACEA